MGWNVYGICSNLASSGELPPASQNHFNHCIQGIGGAYQGLGGAKPPQIFGPIQVSGRPTCRFIYRFTALNALSAMTSLLRNFVLSLRRLSTNLDSKLPLVCRQRKKIAADWTNVLQKSREDRHRYYGNLLIYLLTNQQRWQRNLLGGRLEAGPKNVGPPQATGPCTPIRVWLKTHVKPLLRWTCICVVFTARRYA